MTTARKIAELVLSCDGLNTSNGTLSLEYGDPNAPSAEDGEKANALLELLLQLVEEEIAPQAFILASP